MIERHCYVTVHWVPHPVIKGRHSSLACWQRSTAQHSAACSVLSSRCRTRCSKFSHVTQLGALLTLPLYCGGSSVQHSKRASTRPTHPPSFSVPLPSQPVPSQPPSRAASERTFLPDSGYAAHKGLRIKRPVRPSPRKRGGGVLKRCQLRPGVVEAILRQAGGTAGSTQPHLPLLKERGGCICWPHSCAGSMQSLSSLSEQARSRP